VDSLQDKKEGKKVPFFGLATPEYGFLDNTFFFSFLIKKIPNIKK
jgi:hypothetical protein